MTDKDARKAEPGGPPPVRVVFSFVVWSDTGMPTVEMLGRVEAAMGCTFVRGKYAYEPAWRADLMGMRIYFLEWPGVRFKPAFEMHGAIADMRFRERRQGKTPELVSQDISQGVADLLSALGAGEWRVPTRAELLADAGFDPSLFDGQRGESGED